MKEHFIMLLGMMIVLAGFLGIFKVDTFLEGLYIGLLLGVGIVIMGISQYLYEIKQASEGEK